MPNHKIAVIGSNSMVGSRFCELYSEGSLVKADFSGEIKVDITNKKSVEKFFGKHIFKTLILFSAFTDVDAAEKQRNDKKSSCWQINVEGTVNVAKLCQEKGLKLIFFSTDFVFDGTNGPYQENDPHEPDLSKVSWYGITKIEAEKAVQKIVKDFLIIRIAYPYRAKFKSKDDIAKRILRLYKSGKLYPMFYDQIITPTFIDDIAPAVKILSAKKQIGIFHLASPIQTSQYEFASKLISTFNGNIKKIQKSSIVDFLKKPDGTPRPVKGGLKVEKIQSLGFEPTNWFRGIDIIFKQSKGQLI